LEQTQAAAEPMQSVAAAWAAAAAAAAHAAAHADAAVGSGLSCQQAAAAYWPPPARVCVCV